MRQIEDIKFARTVRADIELAKLCPDNNIKKLRSLVTGEDTIKNIENIMKIIVVLNTAYEEKRHHEDSSYEMNPITIEELEWYTEDDILQLYNQAFIDYDADGKTTIETTPKKEEAE